MRRECIIALRILFVMTLVTGIIYPLSITAFAQIAFPHEANGSLIKRDGKVIGSELIGQNFGGAKYFWSRPSATALFPYNASASSGSNLGPTNPALTDAVLERVKLLKELDPGNGRPIPVDLVTSSGSGLDPDVSLSSAMYQLERVANARGMNSEEINKILRANFKDKEYLILGQPRVNALKLNIALDEAEGEGESAK